MWLALLIVHGLVAFLLLGAVTHQFLSVWARGGAKPNSIFHRFRSVPSAVYANSIVVLYLANATLGGLIYTLYRISARLTLEQGHYWKTFGAFELKEHFVALGLGMLPAYWYFWRTPLSPDYARTRLALTSVLAVVVWWAFLAGHLANNIRGLGI